MLFLNAKQKYDTTVKCVIDFSLCQACSQDLGRGGGFFERVRKVQTTLIRIFIVLESESHDLSENCDGISQDN